jgi:hypothetical protein
MNGMLKSRSKYRKGTVLNNVISKLTSGAGFCSVARGDGRNHSSRRHIAAPLEHSHPDAELRLATRLRAGRPRRHPYSSLLREGLATPPVTRLSRVGSYPTISTLPVPPPKPPLAGPGSMAIGGVFSVALSLGL